MTARLRNAPNTVASFTAVRSAAATLVVVLGASVLLGACAAQPQAIVVKSDATQSGTTKPSSTGYNADDHAYYYKP